MSLVTELADEVVWIIKNQFPSLVVKRGFLPSIKLEAVKKMVLVVPREKVNEYISRSQIKTNTVIDVAYLCKFCKEDASEIDPLTDEVQKLEKLLNGVKVGEGVCISVQNSPIYHPDHFHNWRQFTSVLTLTIVSAECYR